MSQVPRKIALCESAFRITVVGTGSYTVSSERLVSRVASIVNGGGRGGQYLHIHALHYKFLLKSIVFMLCEYEY